MSQTILCLRGIHWHGRNAGLAKHVYGCARGIGAIAEQLRFSGCTAVHRPAFFSGQLRQCGGQGCLRGAVKRGCDQRHARGIARHGRRVLEPMAWKRRTGPSGI
ncbi:hypothetical protein GFL84_06465 [Rhizobium leguminosarum bv. viciae]|nr:hypothetical protein [Rhizobium leguminosarum bv. viciae]